MWTWSAKAARRGSRRTTRWPRTRAGAARRDVEVDWRKPVGEVYDLVRGADPRPGAWTTAQGEQVEVLGCEPVAGEPGAPPGRVVAIEDERLVVAAADGAIAIHTVRPNDERIPAAEYARSAGIATGDVLGAGEA